MSAADPNDSLGRGLRECFLENANMRDKKMSLVNKVIGSSLLREYTAYTMAAYEANRRVANTEPWHALGEMYLTAGALLQAGWGPVSFGSSEADEPWKQEVLGIVYGGWLLTYGVPYLWTDRMFDVAKSTPVPRHVISADVLQHDCMYWSLESSRGTPETDVNWLMVSRKPDHIEVLSDATNPATGEAVINGAVIEYGATYPDDFAGTFALTVRHVLAMLAIINSPYVEIEQAVIPRALRRRAPNAERDLLNEQRIGVVVLRRRAAASKLYEKQDGDGVEWKHQWWVSGHMRAQWHPSTKTHKLIWIAPYLKGPDGAPMAEKVFVVAR